jgi:hypothetical protein
LNQRQFCEEKKVEQFEEHAKQRSNLSKLARTARACASAFSTAAKMVESA